jgi:hypothetical protein
MAFVTPAFLAPYLALSAEAAKPLIEMGKTFELHMTFNDDLVLSAENGVCSWKPAKDAKAVRLKFVEGLADPKLISLESADVPGNFLRHFQLRLRIAPEPRRADFIYNADSTFLVQPSPTTRGICLRSFNFREAVIASTYQKKACVVPDPMPEEAALTIVYRDETGK